MRNSILNLLPKCDHINKNQHIRVLSVVDDISLKVIDGNVDNLVHEINIHGLGLLQLLC